MQKKKKAKKLTATKVQTIVNAAIRRRDGECIVRDGKHSCAGDLTASHYYCVGGCSTFRFYPPNIHTQCFGHHGIHEHGREPFFYRRWMQEYRPDALEFMETHWGAVIKYDQETLHEIKRLAETDDLDGLSVYIAGKIENN